MPNARFTDALSTNFALRIIIITIQRNTCIWQSWLHLWFAFLKPIVSQLFRELHIVRIRPPQLWILINARSLVMS